MIEQFEYKGRWKVPEEETWYNGTLTFSPDLGASLEIFGTFNPGFLNRKTKSIILGETNMGDITLVDNYFKSNKHSFSSDITVGTYKPNYLIIGHHFETTESILFRKVTFKSFNLFEWLDTAGLNHSVKKSSFSLNYEKPSQISFDLFNGCKGIIDFHYAISLEGISNSAEIEESSSVTLEYSERRELKDILMDIYVFNGFVTFATFEQSYPLSITFSDAEYLYEKKQKLIKCSYNNPSYGIQYKPRRKGEHLLDYSYISAEFPSLIHNWYKRYQELRPVFSLMLYSFKDKLKFSEDKFMDIARAIETFHRLTTTCTKLPSKDFELMVQRIYSKIEPADKQWLVKQNAFTYQNECSLKKRLLDLFKVYTNPYLEERIPNIKRFCLQVVNSRNYYTHYNPDKEKEALKGKELFELNQNLKALLITCICKDIGLKDDNFEEGIRRSIGN